MFKALSVARTSASTSWIFSSSFPDTIPISCTAMTLPYGQASMGKEASTRPISFGATRSSTLRTSTPLGRIIRWGFFQCFASRTLWYYSLSTGGILLGKEGLSISFPTHENPTGNIAASRKVFFSSLYIFIISSQRLPAPTRSEAGIVELSRYAAGC